MSYFIQGLGYGLMAFGGLLTFSGGVVMLVSLCCFMAWIGEKINPDLEELCDEYDEENK